jgi:hypothetical protein
MHQWIKARSITIGPNQIRYVRLHEPLTRWPSLGIETDNYCISSAKYISLVKCPGAASRYIPGPNP